MGDPSHPDLGSFGSLMFGASRAANDVRHAVGDVEAVGLIGAKSSSGHGERSSLQSPRRNHLDPELGCKWPPD